MSEFPFDVVGEVRSEVDAFLSRVDFDVARITDITRKDPDSGKTVGFVDLAMPGVGIRSIAILGAVCAMELAGLRLRKIAGTSGGGISAALFCAAGVHNPFSIRTECVAEMLGAIDFQNLVDGGEDSEYLYDVVIASRGKDKEAFGATSLVQLLAFVRNADVLAKTFGVNPGDRFHETMDTMFTQLADGPFTVTEVRQYGAGVAQATESPEDEDYLIVIATDLTHGQRVVFPRDLSKYVSDLSRIGIVGLVRASMSIPYIFQPVRLREFCGDNTNLRDDGDVLFVDGGLTANFPLTIFDVVGRPRCPTIGILPADQPSGEPAEIADILDFSRSVVSTASTYWDRTYIEDDIHSCERMISVDPTIELDDGTTRTVGPWDFNLTPEERLELFLKGARAALNFLERFDFEDYTRRYRGTNDST